MKNLLFIALLFCSSIIVNAQDFFIETETFLKENVSNGLVNYEAIKDTPKSLTILSDLIETFPINEVSKTEQFAFYLNAYNILAIKNVIDNYPLASPLDITGFFDVITHNVAGKQLTLNQIENDIIRPIYNDPRIHFALVCVAKGCPKLSDMAFTANNLGDRLDKLTAKALNDNSFIKTEGTTLKVSEIFKWYRADFGATDYDIIEYINKYSNTDYSGYTLDYYTYDWRLNELK